MIDDPMLSVSEAFQLMGLVQCALLLAYLAGCGGDVPRRLLAGAFFLVLAAGFGLPLAPLLLNDGEAGLIAVTKSALPATSYLLAAQMLGAKFPNWRQFAILLLPLAGAPLVYAGATAPETEACLGDLCAEARLASQVWQILAGGIVLLFIVALSELRQKGLRDLPQGSERTGLALGLVMVNAAVLGAVLAGLTGILSRDEAEFTGIALGLGFIYLATTAMFRIFPESREFVRHHHGEEADKKAQEVPPPSPAKSVPSEMAEAELELLARIRAFLEGEQPHLKENFHRGDMARALGVPEHRLSKVINQGFGKSLIDVLNELRVAEAKRLLMTTDQQITQIAFASGFNALPSFHRVFKKLTGVAPGDWRDKCK